MSLTHSHSPPKGNRGIVLVCHWNSPPKETGYRVSTLALTFSLKQESLQILGYLIVQLTTEN